jgi:molybdenum cofactor biosynthesis enzyme MoaA
MTTFNMQPMYLNKLQLLPRGSTTNVPVTNKCNLPSNTIVVDYLGNCMLCECDGWLPIPVGKVMDFDTVDAVFASEAAQTIQQDVDSGMFSWCAVDHCGVRVRDKIRTTTTLYLNIDESCNLHCPSCRRSAIMISQGEEFDKKIQQVERIMHWLDQYNRDIHIVMSGNGDPLASHIMRPLVKNLTPRPNQTFTLFTNGLLIKKHLEDSKILDNITQFKISVDAGSSAVYQDVRRPGNWHILLQNFDFIKHIGKNNITLLNFAVQKKNYQDIPKFVELCQHYGFTAYIHQLDNWGTWNIIDAVDPDVWTIHNGIFQDHDVLDVRHPEFDQCKQILQQYRGTPGVGLSPMILKKIL